MKKSTMAVAALLTVLAAPVVSVAYADEASTAPMTSHCNGAKGCSGHADCKGCSGHKNCKGCAGE